jgi:hypothetical protein
MIYSAPGTRSGSTTRCLRLDRNLSNSANSLDGLEFTGQQSLSSKKQSIEVLLRFDVAIQLPDPAIPLVRGESLGVPRLCDVDSCEECNNDWAFLRAGLGFSLYRERSAAMHGQGIEWLLMILNFAWGEQAHLCRSLGSKCLS